MQKTKYLLIASLLVALLGSAYLLSLGIRHFSGGDPLVRVTGLSERHISSDLIILPITLQATSTEQAKAYAELQSAKSKTLAFLTANGLSAQEIRQSSISVEVLEDRTFDAKTMSYVNRSMRGYTLTMTLTIRSSKVDQVETISSSISDLISSGINLKVQSASYYYTKLNELKVEMLKEAASDAYNRATIIAEGGGSELGELKSTTMGVFQIVGQYQDEAYSWGGMLNTSSKEKTASVTVKANYKIK
ncbi:MAG: SIMPL domain-containing protein [Porphyromonas sp.]|nr:SIMPL domain-containing protein [Porphyromonas sp.]